MAGGRATGFGPSTFAESLAPHWGQNLASGGLAWPQLGQVRGSAVPHSAQNLASSGTAAWQFGQVTLADLLSDARSRNEPDADHVDVVAFGDKVQGSVTAVPEPILALADIDDVAIHPEADLLLAEQLPTALTGAPIIASIPVATTVIAIETAIIVSIPPLRLGIGCCHGSEREQTGDRPCYECPRQTKAHIGLEADEKPRVK